jgi:hypothetical protein
METIIVMQMEELTKKIGKNQNRKMSYEIRVSQRNKNKYT